MSPRAVLVLAASLVATVAVFAAYLLSERDGDDGPSGPAPAAGDRVPLDAEGAPDEGWIEQTATDQAIPLRAMQAYAAAEVAADRDIPTCNLRWNTIAGIGSVESAHGTLGGAGLEADGTPDTPIIGPALDGTNGTRAIPATEASTALHGDEEWDHAVGPFQFLTSSWERYGADGDGDGVKDPNDIDDAARGAVNHLCEAGHDLAGDGWVPAVFSYNNSMQYVERVREIADSYAG